jgi:uncharacterized delta-60 repeat protein
MLKLTLSACLLFGTLLSLAQSGELDPTFGDHGIVKTNMGSHFNYNSEGRQIIAAPNGSMYIVLNYPTYISKRLPDGSIDSSFGLNGYSRSFPFSEAYAALQPDGKIVIAGSGFNVARINSNGLPDSTFGINGIQTNPFNANAYASSLAIQNDGKIVVAGTYDNGDTYFAVARYNANGNLDNTFNGTGFVTTDFGFKIPPGKDQTDSIAIHVQSALTIAIQANGKIVAGGYASNGYDADFAVARYNTDGSLDNTFDIDGRQTTDFGSFDNACSLAIGGDGKIVLAGSTSIAPDSYFAIARYKSNGSPDSSFNGTGKLTTTLSSNPQVGNSLIAIQDNNKIVVAGYKLNLTYDFVIARFNANGSPDNTFDNDGILITDFTSPGDFTSSDDFAGSLVIQNDNKILVAGYTISHFQGFIVQHLSAARYNTNGSADITFNNTGKLLEDNKQGYTELHSTAIQPDGKVVVAGLTWNGSNYDFGVARFTQNGNIDSSFSNDGQQITDFESNDDNASSIVIQKDGKIIVTGTSNNQFAVARYNTDGSADITFNQTGKIIIPMGFTDNCTSVALQANGKIVIAGYTFTNPNYDSVYSAVARLNPDGTLDNTFNGNGKQLTSSQISTSVAIQSDGKIVAAGRSYLNNQDNFSLIRYNTDGSPDASFSNDGKQNNTFGDDNYFGESVAIQSDGKIVLAGFSETFSGSSSSFAVARYKTNGSLDSTFNSDGFQSTNLGTQLQFGTTVAINYDGRIAVGGTNNNYAIVLYNYDGSLDNTFSNDGIQTTNVGLEGSRINSLAFENNKLYAAGYGQFPGTLGVVARYILAESGPLPVSSLEFTGSLQNKYVLLEWKIATEKNVSSFIIERSADGNRFIQINNVLSQGNGNVTRNYSSVDAEPMQGINFYRLKIIDADGKYTYSNVVAIKINAAGKLRIFPNPVGPTLFVQADGNEKATVRIVDASGRKIKEIKLLLNGTTSFSIDVNNLAQGLYNLILYKENKTEALKFIKE